MCQYPAPCCPLCRGLGGLLQQHPSLLHEAPGGSQSEPTQEAAQGSQPSLCPHPPHHPLPHHLLLLLPPPPPSSLWPPPSPTPPCCACPVGGLAPVGEEHWGAFHLAPHGAGATTGALGATRESMIHASCPMKLSRSNMPHAPCPVLWSAPRPGWGPGSRPCPLWHAAGRSDGGTPRARARAAGTCMGWVPGTGTGGAHGGPHGAGLEWDARVEQCDARVGGARAWHGESPLR